MRSALVALAGLPGAVLAYGDQPPAGHTGGFGEPDCGTCHFAAATADHRGELVLQGLPDRYQAGETYPVRIRLSAAGMSAGGVSISARTRDGRQAGYWQPGEGLDLRQQDGVAYLVHAPAVRGKAVEWTARWTAPAQCAGTVDFHAAGNASNGDDSPFGDRILTEVVEIRPPPDCES